jgi:hypothetical protein
MATPPRHTPAIDPPDIAAAVGRLVYPYRRGAVVRYTAEMLGAEVMTAYPWSRHHGWTASN